MKSEKLKIQISIFREWPQPEKCNLYFSFFNFSFLILKYGHHIT